MIEKDIIVYLSNDGKYVLFLFRQEKDEKKPP